MELQLSILLISPIGKSSHSPSKASLFGSLSLADMSFCSGIFPLSNACWLTLHSTIWRCGFYPDADTPHVIKTFKWHLNRTRRLGRLRGCLLTRICLFYFCASLVSVSFLCANSDIFQILCQSSWFIQIRTVMKDQMGLPRERKSVC